MKIIITSATLIQSEALLDKDSGVIEYQDGRITHILHELQFNKTITVYKEPVKEEKVLVASPEQSDEGKKKKVKQK